MTEQIESKIVEEVTKNTVGKVTDSIIDFISSICMPAAEEFGLILRDQIAYYRMKNLLKIINKTKSYLSQKNIESNNLVSPKLLKEIVEESSWIEDEELQNLWAGLLSGEAQHGNPQDDGIIYTNILKSISAFEARMIKLIYNDYRICSLSPFSGILPFAFEPENKIIFSVKSILKTFPGKLDFIIKNTTHDEIIENEENHHLAYGFLVPQIEALKRHDLIAGFEFTNAKDNDVVFYPTSVGLDLYMRCTGYKIYPIEAYVVTRQHWCVKEKIDPFTWYPLE